VKRQDNITLWNTLFNQTIGNAFFRSIVLNPDFPVADINVEQGTVDALELIPANAQELIMVPGRINDQFHFYLTIRRLYRGVLLQDLLDQPAILR